MRTKRISGTIVIVGLLGAGLVGCSGGNTVKAGDTGTKKSLTVLTYQSEPGISMYNKFFSLCSATNPGYTFKTLLVPKKQLIIKATQLTASGDAPAIVIADNNNVATLADAGILTPIDLKGSALKASDFIQGPFETGQYKGVQYGLPVGSNAEVIVYNKKLLADAGVTAPKSWADLTASAAALTKGDQYGFGQTFAAGETLTWNWLSQLWSNGGSLEALSAPPSVEATEFWTSFILNKTAPHASLGWTSSDLAAQLLAGKLAMAQVGTWVLPALLADAKKANIELGITQQVSPDGKAPITPFGGEIMLAGGVTGDAAKAVNKCIISFSSSTEQLANYDNILGYVPDYVPAQAITLKTSPYLAIIVEQLKTSRGRTTEVGPAYAKYTTAIAAALQKVAAGTATAQQALDEAAASVK